jgi:hypothetical protein
MDLIGKITERLTKRDFKPPRHDIFDWVLFYRLQMVYLLLWSCIERYTALAYGPNLNPEERIRRLGADKSFRFSLSKCNIRSKREISDTRDPTKKIYLDPDDPPSSAKYYYQVRHNLSHRGKGALNDGEIVRDSLKELYEIFNRMLRQSPN